MQFKRSAKLLGAVLAALTLSVAAAPAQDNAPVTTTDKAPVTPQCNAPVTTQDSAPVRDRRSATMASARTNLPVGTKVIVRLNSPLDSGTATQGQTFSGTTASDILIDSKIAVPAGSPVNGIV